MTLWFLLAPLFRREFSSYAKTNARSLPRLGRQTLATGPIEGIERTRVCSANPLPQWSMIPLRRALHRGYGQLLSHFDLKQAREVNPKRCGTEKRGTKRLLFRAPYASKLRSLPLSPCPNTHREHRPQGPHACALPSYPHRRLPPLPPLHRPH